MRREFAVGGRGSKKNPFPSSYVIFGLIMYAEKRSTFPRKKRRKNLQTLTAAGALCFSKYARGLAQKKAIMPQFCLLRKLGLPPNWVRYMIKIATVTKQKRH